MTSVLSTQPWLRDPEVVSIPWRQHMADSVFERASPHGSSNDKTPLKLGIYWTDEVVGPQPPILRGLRTVVNTLKNAGHKVTLVCPLHFYTTLTDKMRLKDCRLESTIAEHCKKGTCEKYFFLNYYLNQNPKFY